MTRPHINTVRDGDVVYPACWFDTRCVSNEPDPEHLGFYRLVVHHTFDAGCVFERPSGTAL